ncbi:PEP/pyruvate-binding domain-containing protein [Mycolicibacterium sp.]|uniref:PEP/pyruvate-binding domain-containing protein n=1 Tax=Mycolicibacterium sp. TaxID=2320850 RepID=UPI0037CA7E80
MQLDAISADAEVSAVGPKIGRLVTLAESGFSVPRGFAITEAGHRRYLAQTGIGDTIDAVLGDLPEAPTDTQLAEASLSISAVIGDNPVPPWLIRVVAAAYQELCSTTGEPNVAVAVRSSASVEDNARQSFAGLFTTRLGVIGSAKVAAAVVECWASIYTAAALDYARRQLSTDTRIAMAVGVQELVNATSAGVAFSVHPVTGRADRVLIEATWGLGGSLVEGAVTPDHIEVGKADLRVLRHDVATKTTTTTFDRELGALVSRPVAERLRCAPVLTPAQMRDVAATVLQIERLYRFPVDIEWVIGDSQQPNNKVVVVQVRPATAVPRTRTMNNGWDAAFRQ